MLILGAFKTLVEKNQEQQLVELIQQIYQNIPQNQRVSKGIVWTLRQIKQEAKNSVPLTIQKQSLNILINSDNWYLRKLTAFIATNCCNTENELEFCIPFIMHVANDSHFGVRESAQVAMRELLQLFPNNVLKLYEEWITDPSENIRRCVSESLRPVLVQGKNWIREQPVLVLEILSGLNKDPSIYVRKSVGNNLSDISRRYPDLILSSLRNWLEKNDYNSRTMFIARKACRNLIKKYPEEVKELLRGQTIIK